MVSTYLNTLDNIHPTLRQEVEDIYNQLAHKDVYHMLLDLSYTGTAYIQYPTRHHPLLSYY